MPGTLLSCQHDVFIIPEGVCYMNCSYISPILRCVEAAAIKGIYRRGELWAITPPPESFDPAEKVRSLFVRMVNGDPPLK